MDPRGSLAGQSNWITELQAQGKSLSVSKSKVAADGGRTSVTTSGLLHVHTHTHTHAPTGPHTLTHTCTK